RARGDVRGADLARGGPEPDEEHPAAQHRGVGKRGSLMLPLIADTESGLPIARPALGLTAYLADTDVWARGGASKVLRLFMEKGPRKRLEFLTTSVMTEWRPVVQSELEELADELTADVLLLKAPRHNFTLTLVDVPDLPEVGFSYTEIDPS